MLVLTILFYIALFLAIYALVGYIWGNYVYIVVTNETDDIGGVMAGIFWPLSFPVMGIWMLLRGILIPINAAYINHLKSLKKRKFS